jgi:pimeloyl-ACP methyl ester carboxylesterase
MRNKIKMLLHSALAAALCGPVLQAQENPPVQPSTPSENVQFISVDDNVKLEVIDWGGTGRPLILLTGLGATAKQLAKFASKLTPNYHVFGITRRGFAPSSIPASGYSADRLGDDVVAVVDALRLVRPVLAGHSIAGEEMSSVANRHPDKISGLVYLEAGYAHALYDLVHGDLVLDSLQVLKDLQTLQSAMPGQLDLRPARQVAMAQLLQALPQLEKNIELEKKFTADILSQIPPARPQPMPSQPAQPRIAQPPAEALVSSRLISSGEQKYTAIPVPVLAIFAIPHDFGPANKGAPAIEALIEAHDLEHGEQQIEAFERQVPAAHVVRLAHATHNIFISNEADVLREMNSFIGSLP